MKPMIFALGVIFLLTGAQQLEAQDFQVVVHAGAGMTEISRGELSRIFKKKAGKLPSGENATPIDHVDGAAVREAFSQSVHGRSADKIAAQWLQQIFAGKAYPPEQLASDAEVLAYVASTPGAVGYVSINTDVGSGVKVVRLLE